ncbi:cellulose biosynthesis protein BcsG [Escherichia coli O157]|nr:cellulose biosynthesis protein BcsG [Escherichia coli O157]
MTQFTQNTAMPSSLWQYWRGLSGWNFYFLVKFGLLWAGYLNFHPLLNLVFAAFLLMPIPRYSLHRLRHWIALPIGFALFWHDTWLPGPESIMSQGSQVAGFSTDYLIDLVTRFINWQMIGAIFVLLVAWLFLSQWIRITVFVVAILLWLNNFYNAEAKRKSTFPSSLPADAQPFELLVINICSLSWSDIEAAGLMSHPLWSHFDIEFKNFNSATSYSGPAAIRLLRASCGQTSHTNLYQPANNDCYLFDNLSKLGFTQHLMMGHNGQFGGFLKEVRENGGMQTELMDQTNLPVILLGFDGSPVYDDTAVLNRWLDVTEKDKNSRSATFYNTLPLHDGNHYPGVSKTADYKARAQKFFDELDAFFTELEKSGRKVMVVVVPEHGGALKGDRMQVSGLRDIPSPSITDVPVGVKFFGMKAPHQGAPIVIDQPSSFLAISDLVVRVLDGKIFTEDNVDWKKLTSGLPQTAPVSENSNAVVIQYQDKPYVRLNGGDWVPYPQ